MATTINLELEVLSTGQADGVQVFNDNMNKLDFLVHTAVNSTQSGPPGSPSNGDAYRVGTSGTGDWAGYDNQLALYIDGWVFFPLTEGLSCYDQGANESFLYNGTDWIRKPLQTTDVVDLSLTIGNPPSQIHVQAISDKIDELLAALRVSGVLV